MKNIFRCKKGLCFFVFCSILIIVSTKSYAAEGNFLHKHTEKCYEKKMIQCTDKKEIDVFNQEFWCDTCKRTTSARVVVENYVCQYEYSFREERRYAYCYTCGQVVHHTESNGEAVHNRLADVCVCNMTEESVIAKVSVTADKTDWTNQNVYLTANIQEMGLESIAPFTIQFSGGTQENNRCLVGNNGTYNVTVKAGNGQSVTVSYKVGNIDKTAPKITECYVDKKYPEYQSASIKVAGEDALSGLADKPYSFDGGKTYVAENSYKITQNGTYQICLKDKAGNVSTKKLIVSCFAVKEEKNDSVKNDTQTVNKTPTIQNVKKNQDEKVSENKKQVEVFDTEETEKASQKEQLIKKLEKQSVPLEKIPGVYSSVMRCQAEKLAVPVIAHTTKKTDSVQSEIKEANDMTNYVNVVSAEKPQTLSKISKWVVAAGVFACVCMSGVVIMLFTKRMG